MGLSLSSIAFRVLCYLTFYGNPSRPKDIAERLKLSPVSVRARLSELNKKGLVKAAPEGYTSTVEYYDVIRRFFDELKEKREGRVM